MRITKDAHKFSIKIAVFLVPISIAFFLIEIGLSKMNNSYRLKNQELEKESSQIETLILGTSHAYYGLDPSKFSMPSLNLANAGQSLIVDKQLLEKILKKSTSLKRIIVELSYFSLGYRMNEESERWRNFFYQREMNIPGDSTYFFPPIFSYIQTYGLRQSLQFAFNGFRTNLTGPISNEGHYCQQAVMSEISDEAGQQRVKLHDSLYKAENEMVIKKNLEEILQLAALRNIQVFIVMLPTYTSYSKFLKPERLKNIDDVVDDLKNTYSLVFKNYLADKRFNKDDFSDNDHLLCSGAKKLSSIIDEELIH